jgi:hypothetical protein
MVRRFLCLGAILLMLLSVSACTESKAKTKVPIVPDPEGGSKVNPPRPG